MNVKKKILFKSNSSIYFKYNRYLPSKSLPVKFINLINNWRQGGTALQNRLVLFNSLKFLNNIKNKNWLNLMKQRI